MLGKTNVSTFQSKVDYKLTKTAMLKSLKKQTWLVFVIFLSFTFFCTPSSKQPKAEKGIFDAQEYFKKPDALVYLLGEWFYYPKLIVFPKDVSLIDSIGEQKFFKVPGVWSVSFFEKGFLAGDGFATFRLHLKHGLKGQALSFRIPEMETAYLMYVDEKLISRNGFVSPDEINALPEYKPKIVDFVPDRDESEVILQISNYHHRKGGPGQVISVGRSNALHAKYEKEILMDMLLVGSIFFMAVYHTFLFFNRKKDPYTFWFALACLLICLRVFVTGNKYLINIFPNLPWELHLKMSYLTFFLIPPVFCRYMYLTFPSFFPRLAYKFIFYVGLWVSAFVLLTNSSIYTYFMIPYQIFTLSSACLGIYVVVISIREKQPGARLFLLSFTVFIATVVNDILVTNLYITSSLLSHYGIFMMFIFQSISIARSFSRGFQQAEAFAGELSTRNKDLEDVRSQLTNLNERLEVKANEKALQLQTKLDQINKDMKLAKSIVNGLITVPNLAPYLEVKVIYQPFMDVGGDIFFIKKIQDGFVRIFLGDATGHGLQAALFTMMIQSEFERLNMVATMPNDLLYYLNQHFYDKNSDLKIYFPALLVDIDFTQSTLRYAAAGIQDQFIHKANGELISLQNTGPIIGILEQYRYGFQEAKIEEGDRIYLFSDGIFEELFETDNSVAMELLMDVVTATRSMPLESVTSYIKSTLFEKMQKTTWKDDVTFLVMEVGKYKTE